MTLYVHIGSHKTGTTAIQRFGANHRDALRERGLWYPSYEEIGRGGHYGHHHFSHAVAGQVRDGFSIDEARLFSRTIRERSRENETILLSAEPIYRHVLDTGGDYWSQRRAYVRKLREVIGAEDVRILVVLRRQDTFALSLYQEVIKTSRDRRTFRQFIVDEINYFEYNLQLEMFREEFGAVDLLIYEDLRRDGLIEAFYRHLGVETGALPPPLNANRSLPIELIEYKRLLNMTGASLAALKDVGKKLSNWANNKPMEDFADAQWVPRREIVAFLESFAEKNQRLRRDFASDHPAPLFPPIQADPAADMRGAYGGMSVDRFAQLTAEIFL
jgi:hypothetical protein